MSVESVTGISNEEIGDRFNMLAGEWEKTHGNWQLTHIRNHPNVKKMVDLGTNVLPFMFQRLTDNVLWFIPIEQIAINEYDEEIKPTQKDDPSLGKYSHLEGNREACVSWGKKMKII